MNLADFYIIFTKALSGWSMPYVIASALVLLVMMAFIAVNVMFLIWLERKVCARIQSRVGPMLAGPKSWARWSMWTGGLLQTPLDALKLLLKEDIIHHRVDRIGFLTAPFICFTASFMAYMVIPFAPCVTAYDLNIGILYFLAVSSFTVISVLIAGWSSNNKYALIGGVRSAAQIISYEIPILFSFLSVVMLAGSMSLNAIVQAQALKGWFILTQGLAFLIYFTAATAELNRPPFDLPEAESELVSGYSTEYSGMRFAMFYLSEFSNLFLAAAIATTLFLGGWLPPFGWQLPQTLSFMGITLPFVPVFLGALIFFTKTYIIIFLFMWVRWTFPRIRANQLLSFSWKVLVPLAFLNFCITGLLALW